MIEKVIFHIGLHKTGSTAIQEFCAKNRNILLKNNIFYPLKDVTRWNGHHPIAWEHGVPHPNAEEGFNSAPYFSKIFSENDKRVLLLSSEDFEFLTARGVENLKKSFQAKKYQVIVFLRNIVDYLFSDYQQHVRGYPTRYSEGIDCFFVTHNFFERVNYHRILNTWSNVFGSESLDVVCYESCGGDVTKGFWERLNISNVQPEFKESTQNVSLSAVSTATLRQINIHFPNLSCETHEKVIDLMYQNSKERDKKKTIISDCLSNALITNMSQSIENAGKKYNFDVSSLLVNHHAQKEFVSDEDILRRIMVSMIKSN